MATQLTDWPYENVEPIRLALTAGDTESDDREGHRMLANYGDNLVPFIIGTISSQLGVSRCRSTSLSSTSEMEEAAS